VIDVFESETSNVSLLGLNLKVSMTSTWLKAGDSVMIEFT